MQNDVHSAAAQKGSPAEHEALVARREADTQFEEHAIDKVEKHDSGYSITHDGYGLFIPDVGIEPKVGDVVRFYGKGFGFRVRGVIINGQVIYYRTEAEDHEHSEVELYGTDASDWLKRWDEGRSVWSISMGGLGPGYEQCIHITLAEILRIMLDKRYDCAKWSDQETWKRDRDQIEKISLQNQTIEALGLSGAQWGAALNLATHFYMHGPRVVMTDDRVKDRHIQVQRTFPVPA